jgi:hypothetical protein
MPTPQQPKTIRVVDRRGDTPPTKTVRVVDRRGEGQPTDLRSALTRHHQRR